MTKASEKAAAEQAEQAEQAVVAVNPLHTPQSPADNAQQAAAAQTPPTFRVLLAHPVVQHDETGRVVNVQDAIDPATGKFLDGYTYHQPNTEISVTYDVGMSLVAAGWLQIDPYDQAAVAVMFSADKAEK